MSRIFNTLYIWLLIVLIIIVTIIITIDSGPQDTFLPLAAVSIPYCLLLAIMALIYSYLFKRITKSEILFFGGIRFGFISLTLLHLSFIVNAWLEHFYRFELTFPKFFYLELLGFSQLFVLVVFVFYLLRKASEYEVKIEKKM